MFAILSTWRHFGFHVFYGNLIREKEGEAVEYPALEHHPGILFPGADAADQGTVVYSTNDGKDRKVFLARE